MTDFIIINGFIFGLVLAAPVGPVGVLCVQRTLSEGRMHGLLSGLGAAVADAIYGAMEKAVLNEKYREKIRNLENPYGNGHAAELIVTTLTIVLTSTHGSSTENGGINVVAGFIVPIINFILINPPVCNGHKRAFWFFKGSNFSFLNSKIFLKFTKILEVFMK